MSRTMTLPVLSAEQVNELIVESQGRAVSFVDSPEWFMGNRYNTHMGRDEVTPTCYLDHGTMASLAFSLSDRIRTYEYARSGAEHAGKMATLIEAEITTEEKRKVPRKRKLAQLYQDLRIQRQDVVNCRKRMEELVAKHFRGFEGRLLIEVQER